MLDESSAQVERQESAEHEDASSGQPQFQPRTASTNTSMLVISIVPVTAMP